MDEDAIGQTIRFIDAMALDRQQSVGGDHPLVQSFWDKVDFILDVEAKAGTKPEDGINRHRDSAKYFAINLNQFDQRVRNLNIAPMQMVELKKVLRGSRRRKFVADQTDNGLARRGPHCWIYEKPEGRHSQQTPNDANMGTQT